MRRENLVGNLITHIFLLPDQPTIAWNRGCGRCLRDSLRLIGHDDRVKSPALRLERRTPKQVIVHHFEETIGGRPYHIEVMPVSNRWRAQLCRKPGMPTAMMPFYGQTPEEAAGQLAAWLSIAHRVRPVPQPVATATAN